MQEALKLCIQYGCLDLSLLVNLYQTAKTVQSHFNTLWISISFVGRPALVRFIPNEAIWLIFYKAYRTAPSLKGIYTEYDKDLDLGLLITLTALGHLNYALELARRLNLSALLLFDGVELNGRLACWEDFRLAMVDDPRGLYNLRFWLMRPMKPSLFSSELLRFANVWGEHIEGDDGVIISKEILKFMHETGIVRSAVALEYLVEKMKQSPPDELICSTWASFVLRHARWSFDFETIQQILQIYLDWKHPLAREYLTPYLRTLRQRIWHYTFVFKAYPVYYLFDDTNDD